MPPLRELQCDVLRALYGRPSGAARHVVANGIEPQRRLEIHRHNVFASLTDALAAVYRTVERLVGRDFFAHMARAYTLAHPPRSGNVHDFGAELPAFAAAFAPAASLPYLADVARMDWAWHEVYHDSAEPALPVADALQRIAQCDPGRRAGLQVRVQPAARLVASDWPVFDIWRANLAPEPPLVHLDAGAQRVLVAQRAGDVVVERLSAAEHALLDALTQRAPLAHALAAALDLDAGFDAAAAIAHHFACGTLVGLRGDRVPA
jgi:hypothetical protein